jgi:nicotinate-nucleotide adenylyltransferase
MNESNLKPSRIGIFGGTFNPIHMGHLICNEEIREKFALESIIFIPSANPPHKRNNEIIDARIRLEMVKISIKDNPYFSVSDIELGSENKSYTIDTLERLRQELGSDSILYFIIGIDAFIEIETWKMPKKLIELCHFIVMTRPCSSNLNSITKLPFYINKRAVFDIEKEKMINYNEPDKNIIVVPVRNIDLSSSNIRGRIRIGKSIKYLVPENVRTFIYDNNLYEGERR